MRPLGINLDGVIDALADRLVERLREQQFGVEAQVRPRLLTVEQAAAYLGRTKAAIQHLVAEGLLPVVRSDRRVFLDVHDLDAWIDRHKQEV